MVVCLVSNIAIKVRGECLSLNWRKRTRKPQSTTLTVDLAFPSCDDRPGSLRHLRFRSPLRTPRPLARRKRTTPWLTKRRVATWRRGVPRTARTALKLLGLRQGHPYSYCSADRLRTTCKSSRLSVHWAVHDSYPYPKQMSHPSRSPEIVAIALFFFLVRHDYERPCGRDVAVPRKRARAALAAESSRTPRFAVMGFWAVLLGTGCSSVRLE